MKKTFCFIVALLLSAFSPLVALGAGGRWLDEGPELDDSAFSFAFVGDTQNMAYHYPDEFPKIYDHIIDVAKQKNLQHVFGLGDITDIDSFLEWEVAEQSTKKLQGVVSYSLVRGNHDSGGNFLLYMTNKHYMDQFDDIYDDCVLNCYMTANVGTIKYLYLCLDYCPSDDVLLWANDVIADHPNHNVIITTHSYLSRYGKPLSLKDMNRTESNPASNCGQEMWDKLIKRHKNITLVVSGHIDSEDIVISTQKGDFGNTVTQVLIDPQSVDLSDGPTGLIAFFNLSRDGKRVQIEYYSSVKGQYFKEKNQRTIEIECLGGDAYATPFVEQVAQILPQVEITEEKFFGFIGIAMLSGAAIFMLTVILIKTRSKK